MQLTITPYDSPNISTRHLSNSKKQSKMPFFSLNRSPPKSSSATKARLPKQVHTSSTVSESYPDTDELTLDGMTLSGMTCGDNTVSTVNLDSVIRRSVNLGGDHYSPEISVRKSSSSTTSSSYQHHNSHGFEPLITDDIDERIQAYRHAVSSYREQQQDHPVEQVRSNNKKKNASSSKDKKPSSTQSKTAVCTDDFFNDEYTLPGVSIAGDSYAEKRSRAKYHEPRARAVFRPVIDSSKRSKAAAATIEPTISSRVKGAKVQNTLNTMRASPETTTARPKNKTASKPPTYIAPRIEASRTTDSSEKENGSSRRGIHKTRSMSSFESGRTSSTTTTKNMHNKKDLPPTLVELPPSTIAMTISPTTTSQRRPSSSMEMLEPSSLSSKRQQRRPSLTKSKPEPLSGSRKQIQSTGLPNPYGGFPDDEGLYDDPPLLPLDDTLCSSSSDSTGKKDDDNTSLSLDLDIMVNQSDKDLMENPGVSGALLLTSEGLKEHDKLMSGSMSPKAMDSASLHGAQYNSWSKSIEQAKGRFKGKSAAAPATPSPVKGTPSKVSPVATATTKSLSPTSQASASPGTKSVAPPSAASDKKACAPAKSTNNKVEKKKRRGLRAFLFGSKKPPATISPFAQDLLEQERRDEEQHRLKEQEEKKELERIESKRRAYLEVARQKEAAAFQLPDSLGSLSNPGEASVPSPPLAVIEESDDDCSLPFDAKPLPTSETVAPPLKASPSMGSSVCSSALPPCIVCRSGERTHIATPCMHFAFCGSCADKLQAKGTCSVCSRANVMFAQVSV